MEELNQKFVVKMFSYDPAKEVYSYALNNDVLLVLIFVFSSLT